MSINISTNVESFVTKIMSLVIFAKMNDHIPIKDDQFTRNLYHKQYNHISFLKVIFRVEKSF